MAPKTNNNAGAKKVPPGNPQAPPLKRKYSPAGQADGTETASEQFFTGQEPTNERKNSPARPDNEAGKFLSSDFTLPAHILDDEESKIELPLRPQAAHVVDKPDKKSKFVFVNGKVQRKRKTPLPAPESDDQFVDAEERLTGLDGLMTDMTMESYNSYPTDEMTHGTTAKANEYGEPHTPYEDFKPLVLKLCTQTLWKGRPESHFTIHRIPGGSYNRIITIKVEKPVVSPSEITNPRNSIGDKLKRTFSSKLRSEEAQRRIDERDQFKTQYASGDFVLRIPKKGKFDFEHDKGIIDYVRELGIPCPPVIFFDNTAENELGEPYLLMEKAEGKKIDNTWHDLTHEQRLQVATQLGIFCGLYTKKANPHFGSFLSLNKPTVDKDGKKVESTVNTKKPDWLYSRSSVMTSADVVHLGLTHRHNLGKKDPYNHYPWAKFAEMSLWLDEEGAFGPWTPKAEPCFHLVHGDFWPRNVLVKINPFSDYAHVSAILDWDMAYFGPAVSAMKAPAWLWQWKHYCEANDEDGLDLIASVEPANPGDQAIKRAFCQAAGTGYTDIAFHEHAFTARKLAAWAWKGRDVYLFGRRWDRFLDLWLPQWKEFPGMMRDGRPWPKDSRGRFVPLPFDKY